MPDYCRVRISAPSEAEANSISRTLVEKKLVAGTMIYSGKSHYWWKGEIVEKVYWNIGAFSLMKHKEAIINQVRALHSDECPIIALNPIDGNEDFLTWIEESVM
ncbi:MAG: divalent-cation tolerance protein CutA [Candidatus Kerfeldbacteria bacterium]|nr:divalent-cation tolerance protein CutA [Candidatus Kerfeldbacteria bacterium]